MYRLTPVPAHGKSRELSSAINTDGNTTASIDRSVGAAPEFVVGKKNARRIAIQVARAVKDWRTVAAEFGIRFADVDRMTSAFEHVDAVTVDARAD